MVRKKMKRAPEASELPNVDLNKIVISWLEALDLPGHKSVPAIPLNVDIFTLLHSTQGSFTQARGLQALRAAVARGAVSARELRLIFLASLLLFIDPDTSPLRKSVKSLLYAAENATQALGSGTDEMVELVAARFLEHFRVMISFTSLPPPTMVMMQQRAKESTALRMAASLRWLAEVPAGKRALLKAQDGSIFIGCIAVLGEVLNMQASVIKRWHGCGGAVGRRTLAAADAQLEPKDSEEGGVSAADLPAALDACSEVLKTAAYLMSMTKEWDVARLPHSDFTATHVCELCLLVLSTPTVQREAITHASTVLVHVAMASWRGSCRWPPGSAAPDTTRTTTSDADTTPPSARDQQEVSSQLTQVASTMIFKSFFSGNKGRRGHDEDHHADVDETRTLLASFLPLPPCSGIAVCRALLHIVDPSVLLVRDAFNGWTEGGSRATGKVGNDNLFFGPILNAILSRCGSECGLQLRFFALQVLEAWCSRAAAFAQDGVALQSGFPVFSAKRKHDGDGVELTQALSEVMGVAMKALVHPAKIISSLAPALLEHAVNLRHSMLQAREGVESGDISEWEHLAERVLQQPATFKGKYAALGVLLPRVGALRLLDLCPSLVEQLVWAVGVRGNVSGQATTLLLEVLKAISTEVRVGLLPATESAGALDASDEEKAESKGRNTSPIASKARLDAKAPVGSGKATTASTQRAASLCRKWWLGPAAAALMQGDSWSRSHVAAYLLPEVFKFDPASAAALSAEVRGHVCDEERDTGYHPTLLADAGGCMNHDVRRIWAMIEVARFARKCGATTGLTLPGSGTESTENRSSAGLLQLKEVRWASLHVDETLRMCALSLLCTDLKMTTVPPATETDLLREVSREVLPYSLKVFGAQSRQLLLRALQTLLIRMRETVRVCVKEQSTGGPSQLHRGADSSGMNGSKRRKHKQADGAQYGSGSGSVARSSVSTGAAWDGEEGEGEVETVAQTVERVEVFVRWLGEEVLRSLYPGCPFEREVLGLEIVQLVLSELVPVVGSNGTDLRESALAKVVSSSIFRRCWVDTLLALLGSSWDRTRSLAYAVLSRFPCPLAGYEGVEGAKCLAAEGLRLSGSGRQQESDRGALILRLVFISHAQGLGLDVPLFAAEIGDRGRDGDVGSEDKGGEGLGGVMSDRDARGQEEGGADAAVRFLEGLRAVLSHRLGSLQHLWHLWHVWDGRRERQEDTAIPDDVDPLNTPPANPPSVEANITLLPHGLLLAVHHVLLDSELPNGGRTAKGRKPRGANRRSAPVAADGATNEHTISSSSGSNKVRVKGTVQLLKRRAVVGALLEQAFRALRLSLLIVGEHSGVVGGARVCGEGGEGGVGGHSSSCGGEGNGQPGGGDAATHTTRSARSVNANGHVGMVSVDSHGHAVSTPLAMRPSDSGAGAGDERVARVGVKTGAGRSTAEGQRAVVGAWLLAKEACRCLATMVTASPLPAAQVAQPLNEATSSNPNPKVDAGGGVGASTLGDEEVSMEPLLTSADVTKIGDTLLDSLLSLKHMGCVASAQAAFQAVCEALLHEGRRNPSLMCLPSIWLDKLLQQLDGSQQEFVLRRSTGLALAFVSILRAEPRSVEPVLLPRCMRHLLALAQPERWDPSNIDRALEQRPAVAGDWKSTVHALNVLRVVFVDATLADDVGPYVTQATMAAVCGFEDPTWAVRNSSMMVFASIMQRAVGGAKNSGPANPYSDGTKRPHSCRGAITAEAFFQQHAKLHPFLLYHLKRAADHASQHSASASPSASAGVLDGQEGAGAAVAATSRAEMHPVLYPILLLLARLRAGGEAAETGAEQNEGGASVALAGLTSTAAFVPLVIQCASNPHYLARAASSRALTALVPPARASGVIAELLRRLPKDAADDRCFGAGAHNHIHGTLLQITELLLAARTSQGGDQLSETSAIDRTRDEEDSLSPPQADHRPDSRLEKVAMTVGAAVLNLLWLTDPALSPCPPVRHAMLNLLQVLTSFAGDGRGFVGKVRSALKTCWEVNFADAIQPGSAGRVVPGRSVLVAAVVEAAVRRRLGRALVEEAGSASGGPTNEEGGETLPADEVQFVASLLTSPDTDVRDSAIQATKKFFGPGSGHDRKPRVSQERLLLVWAAAANALMLDVHPPNVRRLVRLLSRVGLCLRACSLPGSVGLLWDHLRGLCEDGTAGGSEEVHAGALEVMGVIVRLGKPVAEGSRCAVDFGEYADLLEAAADALMPVSTRAASAASLASSRLLGTAAPRHIEGRTGPGECDVSAFVRLWFVALSLLQDDAEHVRICAARACADAADSSPSEVNAGGGVSASSEGGGRVDLFAVDLALARVASLAENPRDDGRAAEQFALNLLRVLASPLETSGKNPAAMQDNVNFDAATDADAGAVAQEFKGGDVDMGIAEASEDGGMIFGREERNQFQEPGLFSRVAAPYLLRALRALDARDRKLPGAVVEGMAGVLDGLAEKLEGLKDSPSATWLPAVYLGVTSATAVGGAVLEFTVSRHDRKHDGDRRREGDVDLSREIDRAVKACEDFEAVLDGNVGVHPEVSRGVGLALRAARQ